jgi:hypothetical protein
MIDDTIGTSINLGDAQLHQFPKFSLERRFSQISFDVVRLFNAGPSGWFTFDCSIRGKTAVVVVMGEYKRISPKVATRRFDKTRPPPI